MRCALDPAVAVRGFDTPFARVPRTQEDANIRWFLLKEGELAFDPVTQNYFALNYIPEEKIAEAVSEAEKVW